MVLADYTRVHRARIHEGYPSEPWKVKAVDAFVYTGLRSAFDQAGYQEVERLSETRPIMRLDL